jgi:hypothetical protein
MTRKQRVTRAVYAAFILLVAAFTASSITQVARRVFGGPDSVADSRDSRFPKVAAPCGEALKRELEAIEAARVAASSENDAETAKARYASERAAFRERAPATGGACEADPHGADALAALARVDKTSEAHALRAATDLSPVRLAAQSFIRGPAR